ncbi:unnamed protein product [Calypogeia fissa]
MVARLPVCPTARSGQAPSPCESTDGGPDGGSRSDGADMIAAVGPPGCFGWKRATSMSAPSASQRAPRRCSHGREWGFVRLDGAVGAQSSHSTGSPAMASRHPAIPPSMMVDGRQGRCRITFKARDVFITVINIIISV